MKTDEIKLAIQALPDEEIKPLLGWLNEYYDGDVWDRQIENDIERLGVDNWAAALSGGMAQAGEKHQAALRLMNNMQFTSAADRDQCLKDFSTVIGESLDADGQ